MGMPIMAATTTTTTMTAVWLMLPEDLYRKYTIKLMSSMTVESRMLARNMMKQRQLRLAMQVPTNPQWWSYIYTQFWHEEQWLVLLGRQMWQVWHTFVNQFGGTRYFQYFYESVSRKGRRGIIPGSLQAVRQRNRYIEQMESSKIMGRAGVTFQVSPTMNTQKGIIITRLQTCMQMRPARSLPGPAMQQLQKKRLWPGHIS